MGFAVWLRGLPKTAASFLSIYRPKTLFGVLVYMFFFFASLSAVTVLAVALVFTASAIGLLLFFEFVVLCIMAGSWLSFLVFVFSCVSASLLCLTLLWGGLQYFLPNYVQPIVSNKAIIDSFNSIIDEVVTLFGKYSEKQTNFLRPEGFTASCGQKDTHGLDE